MCQKKEESMKLLKSCIISFSMYSKIPMPQFEWEKEDMKYMLVFFPWIGAVIGILLWFWNMLCNRLSIGVICYVLISTLIPLAVTGGFHVDGFMDTMDAFHSYQPKEKKFEILKDSHIGAFSVIMLVVYGLLYVGAFSEIAKNEALKVFCCGFFLARCLSGISVVTFKSAKNNGLLFMFADTAQKKIVKSALYIQLMVCTVFMLCISIFTGVAVIVAALCSFIYYYYRSNKELGGITGDTAGYFVTVCECAMAIAAALTSVVF